MMRRIPPSASRNLSLPAVSFDMANLLGQRNCASNRASRTIGAPRFGPWLHHPFDAGLCVHVRAEGFRLLTRGAGFLRPVLAKYRSTARSIFSAVILTGLRSYRLMALISLKISR